jgi:hypothetical protein
MDYEKKIIQQILNCKSGNEKIACYAQYYIECLENAANNKSKNDDICNIFVKEFATIFTEEMKSHKKVIYKSNKIK